MLLKSNGIRKAAILVSSLDQASADHLLDQMGPRQAQRVRNAVFELGHIDPAEQKRVIEEFFRLGPMLPGKYPPGIELDSQLAKKLSLPAGPRPSREATSSAGDESAPFGFLQKAEDDKLARILLAERPQTIALVLAHLEPEQAGGVLARFAPALQVEVIRRLVDLEETEPEILREVERALEARLSEQVPLQRRRVAGLSAVTAILEASGQRLGMQILDNVNLHDQSLAEKLGPQEVEFSELMLLDDRSLGAIVEAAEPEVTELALVGAPPALVERVLRLMFEPEACRIRQQLDHPGPTRLSDVEEARRRMADVARRLAFARRIDLGPRPRAAASGRERVRVAA